MPRPYHTDLTPQERSLRARNAALTKWAHADGVAGTQKARDYFRTEYFENQVDPNHELSEKERRRRAESARRQFYSSLAFYRSRGKSKKAAQQPRS